MAELDSRITDVVRSRRGMIEYCLNRICAMSDTTTCAKCGSGNTTVTRVKGAWGPFARLVEYPGMGKKSHVGIADTRRLTPPMHPHGTNS